MVRTGLKFGGLAGLLMGVVFSVTFFLAGGAEPDYALGQVIGYITMIVSMTMVYVGIRHYRNVDLDGSIPFRTAVLTGLWITAVASGIFTVFDTLYVTVINPDFFTEYTEWEVARMVSDGATASEVDDYRENYEVFLGPVGVAFNALVMFATVFFIGLVVTLLSAFMLTRSEQQ